MGRSAYSILVVDDDENIRETLIAILKTNDYVVVGVGNANEALARSQNQHFDLFLLDIKLPDMEGTQLLDRLQKLFPESVKIMITGQPSFENAASALNMGADSYFTKPFEPEKLLETVKNKLQECERKERLTGKKLEEWVRLRISKTQSKEYNKFAEETATTFGVFGLSKTQAKIYLGLNALGVASASEIATLSNVRREEVYRTLPELEKRGLVTSKLGSPRRFVATEPKAALKILVKTRIDSMKKEVAALRSKRTELISQLENTSFGIDEENSIDALFQQDNVQMRLDQVIKKARRQILVATSIEETRVNLLSALSDLINGNKVAIEAQIILDDLESLDEVDDSIVKIAGNLSLIAKSAEIHLELRQVKKLPFNLVLIDNAEAIWGDFQTDEPTQKVLWTNDQTQISILNRAFAGLWSEAKIGELGK